MPEKRDGLAVIDTIHEDGHVTTRVEGAEGLPPGDYYAAHVVVTKPRGEALTASRGYPRELAEANEACRPEDETFDASQENEDMPAPDPDDLPPNPNLWYLPAEILTALHELWKELPRVVSTSFEAYVWEICFGETPSHEEERNVKSALYWARFNPTLRGSVGAVVMRKERNKT